MSDRWHTYSSVEARAVNGWSLDTVTAPSRLFGANGMTIGPDTRLYVTQAFGSQVTAIDVDRGDHQVFSALGGGIIGPDDGYFDVVSTFFATEPLIGRVSAKEADGSCRVVRDDLPGANGVTMDHAGRRLFVDEFRPGGRLMELDPTGVGEPRFLMEDLNGPNALAMGPDGRLYFPQVFADEIWVYDLDAGRGQLLFDGLGAPTAVKFDSRGRIVVSESSAGQITAIDVQTGAREILAEVPKGIDNVSVGPGDRIFVSHYVSGRVAEETGNRHRILSEPGLVGPFGLARAANGDLLLADGLSVAAIDGTIDGTVDGTADVRRLHTFLVDLSTLAVGVSPFGDDLAVLGLAGEVLVYRRDSSEPVRLVAGLAAPTGIVADRVDGVDGLLVVERGAGQVTRIDREGRTQPLVTGLRNPGAVARDADGALYVSQGTTVEVFAADGSRRGAIDGFTDAQGVAVAGDVLLVADVGARELVTVEIGTGTRTVAATGVPIGQPVEGFVVAAFCSVCPDGGGGFFVGCNGDGSVRRLTRAR
jgi:streptogramin lyase